LTVSEGDARLMHRDDPASVSFGAQGLRFAGGVEWVRRSGSEWIYSADVAVEFRDAGSVDRRELVSIEVVPKAPQDSVAAAVASAVVELPLGPAVFTRVAEGVYQVQWVSGGPPIRDLIVLRDGVAPGTAVVARGLVPLVEAARESLAQRAPVRPR